MTAAEVARSYDAIAHRWLEPLLAANGLRQHEFALRFRTGGGRALDVGCGCNGRFLRLLSQQGYEVEGLDVSPSMIALAREHDPGIDFHLADVCEWQPAHRYDFITAWDSLWHVPLESSASVLRKLCDALNPGGVIIWTTAGLNAAEEKWDSAMGPPMYYSVLGMPQTLQILAEAACVCLHLEHDQWPEKHVFLIAQKPAIES